MMMCKALAGVAERTCDVSFWLRNQSNKDRPFVATGRHTVGTCDRAIELAGVRRHVRTDNREVLRGGRFVSAGDFVTSQALPAHWTMILGHPLLNGRRP